ncbi:hypothetical protein GCM10025865_05770 [Paraoerskovia sediminicola]|uniref:Uncharacterized protein n=2 Tax=Paraoerskovia sediminicola TaxID=1138587 RepID=A0ABN6X8X2_9CELL|nr:hypothetical protein GCM10025865_05770 [Paraoerskovia sediminicola]
MVNWEFFDNQTPETAKGLADSLTSDDAPVVPTRGAASVCSFKQMSRVLAGFTDGRADEGSGAGTASLAGLRLARENDWTAPGSEAPEGAEDKAPAAVEQEATTTKAEPAVGEQQSSAERETETTEDVTPGGPTSSDTAGAKETDK